MALGAESTGSESLLADGRAPRGEVGSLRPQGLESEAALGIQSLTFSGFTQPGSRGCSWDGGYGEAAGRGAHVGASGRLTGAGPGASCAPASLLACAPA